MLILQYETKEQLYEHMIECDIIMYDITEDPDQIDEAVWAVSGIVHNWRVFMWQLAL